MRDIGFRFFVFGLEAPIGLTLPLEVESCEAQGDKLWLRRSVPHPNPLPEGEGV